MKLHPVMSYTEMERELLRRSQCRVRSVWLLLGCLAVGFLAMYLTVMAGRGYSQAEMNQWAKGQEEAMGY